MANVTTVSDSAAEAKHDREIAKKLRESSGRRVVELPIVDKKATDFCSMYGILPMINNIRKDSEESILASKEFEELKGQIDLYGNWTPVELKEEIIDGKKALRLIAGYRRMLACFKLKKPVVLTYQTTGDSSTFEKARQFRQNRHKNSSQDTNVLDLVDGIEAMLAAYTSEGYVDVWAQASKELGISKATYEKIKVFKTAPDIVKINIRSRRIVEETARELIVTGDTWFQDIDCESIFIKFFSAKQYEKTISAAEMSRAVGKYVTAKGLEGLNLKPTANKPKEAGEEVADDMNKACDDFSAMAEPPTKAVNNRVLEEVLSTLCMLVESGESLNGSFQDSEGNYDTKMLAGFALGMRFQSGKITSPVPYDGESGEYVHTFGKIKTTIQASDIHEAWKLADEAHEGKRVGSMKAVEWYSTEFRTTIASRELVLACLEQEFKTSDCTDKEEALDVRQSLADSGLTASDAIEAYRSYLEGDRSLLGEEATAAEEVEPAKPKVQERLDAKTKRTPLSQADKDQKDIAAKKTASQKADIAAKQAEGMPV